MMAISCPFNLQMLRGHLPCPLLVKASIGQALCPPGLQDAKCQCNRSGCVLGEYLPYMARTLKTVATAVRTVSSEGVGMTGEFVPTTFASHHL